MTCSLPESRHRPEVLLTVTSLEALPGRYGSMVLLYDSSESVDSIRDLAIRCVQRLGMREHIPCIRKYVRDPNDATRIAAIVALSQWGDEESRPAFVKASESSNPRLQRCGKMALDRLGQHQRQ